MGFDIGILELYIKKIYGYAYSKTGNVHDAADLSQNILLTLASMPADGSEIADPGGYIYKVCGYCSANFFRKNRKHFEGLCGDELLGRVPSGEDVCGEVVRREQHERLKREILYLSASRRDALILRYFENKSSREIAGILRIPESTVRWHLSKSKEHLKERFEMSTDKITDIFTGTPKRLRVFFCGSSPDIMLHGLRKDLIVHNICLACRGEAKSLEDIAASMDMPAAYIEDKLGDLVYMDYLIKTPQNRYLTNFLIKDSAFVFALKKYEYENFPAFAEDIYTKVRETLPAIKGFIKNAGNLRDELLLWIYTADAIHETFCSYSIVDPVTLPKRADGGEHRIIAEVEGTDPAVLLSGSSDEGLAEFIRNANGFGAKFSSCGDLIIRSFDFLWMGEFRKYFDDEIPELKKFLELPQGEPDSEAQTLIASLAQKGFVTVPNGKASLAVPYMDKDGYAEYHTLVKKNIAEPIAERYEPMRRGYAELMGSMIPAYLDAGERYFHQSRFYEPAACMYLLDMRKLLPPLAAEEMNRYGIMLYGYAKE